MRDEISGDDRLTLVQRVRYLAGNLLRNIKSGTSAARRSVFTAARLARTPSTASPGRALTEAFLGSELPKMLPPGPLRVLEIGCGSGSLTKLLTEFGYSGSYVGVDIADRFDHAAPSAFQRTFVELDAHRFEPDGQFDLVVSVSALEHIPNDQLLIDRLAGFVAPGGLQVHFVPSGWGLFAYLWHGYRQYPAGALDQRVGEFSGPFPVHYGWGNSPAPAPEATAAPTLRVDAGCRPQAGSPAASGRHHVRGLPDCRTDAERKPWLINARPP